ncbi:MAG: putative lipid II flippase FtsW [Opitutaceae bacterium]
MAQVETLSTRWRALFSPVSLILLCVVALTTLGVIVLFSASVSFFENDPYFFVRRQVIWLLIALVSGFLATRVNLESLRPMVWLVTGAAILSLVVVLIPGIGIEVNGSRRWLDLGLMRLQVSEFAKLALVFGLAHYLAANQQRIPSFWRGFVLPAAGISVFCLLILLEPDFGTAMLCGAIGFTMLLLAGSRMIFLIPSVLAGITLFAVAIMHNPVRLARITSFLDVEAHRADGAYQLWQAILAFGAGGPTGVGLGNGRQQMAFLPEAHTDFIFAIVGEELGLGVTLGVVALFALIFMLGLAHLRRAPNLFQFLIVAGCLLMLTFQALINLGVVTGCLPTKGMSLPFISYGGSNLVLMALLIGILLNTRIAWSRPALTDTERSMKEING